MTNRIFKKILKKYKTHYNCKKILMSYLVFILISLLMAFLITFFLMPIGIKLLIKLRIGKNIRSEWLLGTAEIFEKLHLKKWGTPTMWGIILIFSMIILVLLSIGIQLLGPITKEYLGFEFNNNLWNRNETYLVIFTLISVGIIGAIDDYLNVRGIGRTKWLSARVKMILLTILACAGAYWFYAKLGYSEIHFPFIGTLQFGFLYILIFLFVFIGTANSVNITDGLDGLAGGLLLFEFLAYGAITYMRWMFILSGFCFIISGILLAFLWFNIRPAKVFMGDTGSLAFGATLAIIALQTDTLIPFIVMSGVFIFEMISVILQLLSKKFRKWKKIFKVAPFHHHLEAIGWEEETIVMRLWLMGIILAIVGVMLSISIK